MPFTSVIKRVRASSYLLHATMFLGASMFACGALFASDDYVLTEEDFLVEIPLVSGPTHMDQTLAQTPASVTIIDRQTIQASTAVGLIDLFRLVPGFQTYFVDGSRMGTTYHALGDEYPRRLEVKVDGRSVYESLFSAVEWSSLGVTLDEIEYIEVVRGANAAADGSNAFLASINIVTRSPLLDSGWVVNSQLGTGATRNASVAYTGKLGSAHHRTTLSFRRNDGFDDSSFKETPIIVNDSSENITANFRGLWTPTASDSVEFQAGVSDSDLGIGEREYFNRNIFYRYQYVNWTRLTRGGNKIKLALYHNDLDITDETTPLTLSEAIGVPDTSPYWPLPGLPDKLVIDDSNHSESERWDLELRSTFNPLDNLRAVTGVALRYDRVAGQELFDSSDDMTRTSHRAYSNLEWTATDKLVFNAGLIYEDNTSADSYHSYRVAGNYQLNQNHIFRIAHNRSFRSPTLLENMQKQVVRYNENIILDASVISDSDIDNEQLRSIEFGYVGYLFDQSLNLDMCIYHEQLTDVINERRSGYPDLDNFVNIRDNTDTLDVDGFEIQVQYKPDERFMLRGYYSFSDIDGWTLYTSPPAIEIRDLGEYSLKHGAGLMASYRYDSGITISSTANYNAATKHFRGQPVESHTRVDLKAAKRVTAGRSKIDLSFTVQNVGDPYSEFYQYHNFETQYILGVRLSMP